LKRSSNRPERVTVSISTMPDTAANPDGWYITAFDGDTVIL
jgi:hypothetical protein